MLRVQDKIQSALDRYYPSHQLPSHIAEDSLPSGVPLLGPLFGFTREHRKEVILKEYAVFSSAVHRRLYENEEEHLAFHMSRGLSRASYGPPLGVLLGLGRFLQTWEEMRFPFINSLKNSSTNNNNNLGKTIDFSSSPLSSGNAFSNPSSSSSSASSSTSTDSSKTSKPAASTWDGKILRFANREILASWSPLSKHYLIHAVRGFAYVSLGLVFVPAIVSSYARTTQTVHILRDPVLSELVQAGMNLVNSSGPSSRNSQRNQTDPGPDPRRKFELDQTQKKDNDLSTGSDDMITSSRNTTPTSQSWQDLQRRNSIDSYGKSSSTNAYGDASDEDPDSPTFGSLVSHDEAYDRDETPLSTFPRPEQRKRGASYQQDLSGISKDQSSEDMFSSIQDDQVVSSPQSVSAWDRIRQNAGSSTSSSSSSPESSWPESSGQPYRARGSSDSLSDAQREFDERLERERRGGDFSR